MANFVMKYKDDILEGFYCDDENSKMIILAVDKYGVMGCPQSFKKLDDGERQVIEKTAQMVDHVKMLNIQREHDESQEKRLQDQVEKLKNTV